MSFDLDQLQQSLENLKAEHDSPVVVFEYRGLKIHLRDLDAEEDAVANEHSYSEVEEAVRSNHGRPDAKNFARSMAASFQYQMAYVALAIRSIEQNGQTWDVDTRPHDMIEVRGEQHTKFDYFLRLVRGWGSSIPHKIYEYLNDVRQKREQEVDESLNVIVPPEPPQQRVSSNQFREIPKEDESNLSAEDQATLENNRLASLRDQQGA